MSEGFRTTANKRTRYTADDCKDHGIPMTSSSEQPPKESLVDEMMQEYSCIFYPMCFKARELLYCPKKIGKAECDDYRQHPAPAQGLNFRPECPHHMYYEEYMGEPEKHICNKRKEWETEAARKAREDVLKEVRIKLSKLKTAYSTGADFVWWLVIDTALDELLSTTPHTEQKQPRSCRQAIQNDI